ncbi:hypothetical protein [Streptomyces sp. NPDC059072]|uniref:hypothetical protein n=1 Tax=Streptomyces sp. NPDC059072 TaxID=3346715 RepID=UPI0036B1F230
MDSQLAIQTSRLTEETPSRDHSRDRSANGTSGNPKDVCWSTPGRDTPFSGWWWKFGPTLHLCGSSDRSGSRRPTGFPSKEIGDSRPLSVPGGIIGP